jgi:hypothetical protein
VAQEKSKSEKAVLKAEAMLCLTELAVNRFAEGAKRPTANGDNPSLKIAAICQPAIIGTVQPKCAHQRLNLI